MAHFLLILGFPLRYKLYRTKKVLSVEKKEKKSVVFPKNISYVLLALPLGSQSNKLSKNKLKIAQKCPLRHALQVVVHG